MHLITITASRLEKYYLNLVKRFDFLFSLISALVALGQNSNLGKGLALRIPFCNTIKDLSIHSISGTYNGSFTQDKFLQPNSVAHFDGTSFGVLDGIGELAGVEFTINVWLKSDNVTALGVFLKGGNYENATEELFGFGINYPAVNAVDFSVKYNNPNCNQIETNNFKRVNAVLNTIKDGNFHMLTGVSTIDSIFLYYDGSLVGVNPYQSKVTSICKNGKLQLGRNWINYPEPYFGDMDDLSIFGRRLTANEILSLYQTSANCSCASYLAIDSITPPLALCPNQSVNISAYASGNPANYLWSNGHTNISFNTSVAGSYSLTVSGACNNVQTTTSVLSYVQPTVVNHLPFLETCTGISVSTKISTTGQNLSYLWSNGNNNRNLILACDADLTLSVSGICGLVLTTASKITFGAKTKIIGKYAPWIDCDRKGATLSISALGKNLSCNWSSGNSTSSFTTTALGNYQVTVSGLCGDTIATVVYAKGDSTKIVRQPMDEVICYQPFTTLDVSATGSNLTYLWNNYPTTSSININKAGDYDVTVSGTCNTIISSKAKVVDRPFTSVCGTVLYLLFSGDFLDYSGYDNHAINGGSVFEQDRHGKSSRSLRFDDSFVLVKNSSSLELDEYTLIAWIKPDYNFNSKGEIMKQADFNTANDEKFGLAINYPTSQSLDFAERLSSSSCLRESSRLVRLYSFIFRAFDSNFHMIAAVAKKDSSYIYLDGALLNSTRFSQQKSTCNVGDIQIGRDWLNYNHYFRGSMDDTSIHDRPLSQKEISYIYNSTTLYESVEENILEINEKSKVKKTLYTLQSNPGKSKVRIVPEYLGSNTVKVTIINDFGQKIYDTHHYAFPIKLDVSEWSSDLYLISIQDILGGSLLKLIKV